MASQKHWVICDRCGVAYRNSVMKEQWDGLIVDPGCFEHRHPQDLVRGMKDDTRALGYVRPDDADNSNAGIDGSVCNLTNSAAVAGIGVAGCAVAGRDQL